MANVEPEELVGTFPSLMAEGALLSRRGQHSKALLCFTNALQLQKGDKHCLVARSKCYLKLGDTENSLKDAEASLQNDKTFSKSKKMKQKLPVNLARKDQKRLNKQEPIRNTKAERQLLGELYADKAYLEKLLKDEDLIRSNTKQGMTVEDLILGGIKYLDTRTEFWQQQKPIYARVRDRKLRQQRWIQDKKRKPSEVARHIVKSMEDIDMLLTSGCPEGSCKKAEHVLKTIKGRADVEVPNKNELIGNLYSCIGNAQIDMGQMGAALQSHKMDLEIAKENDLPDAISRALDNIGRVYARIGKFQEAIDTWEEKIPMAKTSLEKTWLFHEIGRCYLELNQATEGLEYGEKSLQSAEEEGDVEWQLNASVLVAQAQVKLEDYQSAVMNFEKALEKAKLVHNDAAQQAIIIALDDANKDFIEELKVEKERRDSFKDFGYVSEYFFEKIKSRHNMEQENDKQEEREQENERNEKEKENERNETEEEENERNEKEKERNEREEEEKERNEREKEKERNETEEEENERNETEEEENERNGQEKETDEKNGQECNEVERSGEERLESERNEREEGEEETVREEEEDIKEDLSEQQGDIS
ncbi:outer dynein arm-docking complex subunit 4 isoform X3 [Alligator mississippiensis]|uniref:outer dynein arm-docking complex subunit 4 isoform X3 n=1 Tax=Alligator mississippiensis TaxID=8496 RepID=UPI002877D48F|nr:outer dynein arm-docking complex subunit 4 isoform X3 [Alligator mississippiensis]